MQLLTDLCLIFTVFWARQRCVALMGGLPYAWRRNTH